MHAPLGRNCFLFQTVTAVGFDENPVFVHLSNFTLHTSHSIYSYIMEYGFIRHIYSNIFVEIDVYRWTEFMRTDIK